VEGNCAASSWRACDMLQLTHLGNGAPPRNLVQRRGIGVTEVNLTHAAPIENAETIQQERSMKLATMAGRAAYWRV
jgi:hypothetical protein